MSAETEGYVVRWPLCSGAKAFYYRTPSGGRSPDLAYADVTSLRSACGLVSCLRSEASLEIVRVRRVQSADRWEPMTDDELKDIAIETNYVHNGKHRRDPAKDWFGTEARFVKRIPGEPQWEVCDEE